MSATRASRAGCCRRGATRWSVTSGSRPGPRDDEGRVPGEALMKRRRSAKAAGRSRRSGAGGPLERAAHAILADAGSVVGRLASHNTRAVAAAAESVLESLEQGGSIY